MMENSSSNGLGKLLPKALVPKRKRRGRKSPAESDESIRRLSSRETTFGSDGTNNSTNNVADEEDVDGRSFGSYESGGVDSYQEHEPSQPPTSVPPARPNTISAHPSQVGYLTTSSPVVQATHVDSITEIQPDHPAWSERGQLYKSTSPRVSRESLHDISPVRGLAAAAKSASPSKRARAPTPRIETNPPRTPPTDDQGTPVIVNTPPTPVEFGYSRTSTSPERKLSRKGSGSTSSTDGSIPSRTMSAHRRTKSGSASIGPSKLSNITLAPLTPTPENIEPAPASAGFFSSMFSAAQNAASSISSNIQTTGIGISGNKSRASTPKPQSSPGPSQVEVEPPHEPQSDSNMDQKESAVRTLGAGELSLSQLGLPEPAASTVASPATLKFPDVVDTRARSESAPVDAPARQGEFLQEESNSRPRSLYEAAGGDQTPPQAEPAEARAGEQRSPSIKSNLKPHRKRGSSVATSVTAGGGNTPVIQPSGTYGAPKLTGFAIASKKRNRDFHSFFKSVPDDDYLIEDYSCALQREILAHGRLYVSEGHLCFSSNILGWTTTLVMSFDEIVSVEKRSTALLFKNGLMISTLHAKHVFASFTSRDATYDLIVNIWKLGHPTLKSTLNGVQLEGTGGDKTEKVDSEPSGLETETQAGSESEEDSDDEDEDEDEDFYDEEESEPAVETQTTDANGVDGDSGKPTARKVSGMAAANGAPADASKDAPSPSAAAGTFPGPTTHPATECGDTDTHYEKILADEIIPAPLGKVYSMLFGQASAAWLGKWITEDQKCTELQIEDKKGLSLENKTRAITYIKPLNSSIGPKQTKCIVNETLESLDFEKAASLKVTTQNPDVPNGNIFSVKTKYCISWAENNATRVQVNCTTEWTGKSWLKGPIEKAVNDGQAQYCKELFAALKASVSSRPRSNTAGNGAPKSKKKGKKNKAQQSSADATDRSNGPKHASDKNWGLLEPVRPLLEPCVDLLRPILTGNIMYGLLVGLLVATWFGFGFTPGRNVANFGADPAVYSAQRLAAYEEMWWGEDSELWDWLEERVGLERLNADVPSTRKRAVEPRTLEHKLKEERMNEREMKEAIRVTEEKLRVLRDIVGRASQEQGSHA